MSDAVTSSPAVPMNELPKCCIEAMKRGKKVITYMCWECRTMRQFETARTVGHRRIDVVCECGHQQALNVF